MIPNKQRVDLYHMAAILFLYSPCIDLSIVDKQIRPWLACPADVSKTLDLDRVITDVKSNSKLLANFH